MKTISHISISRVTLADLEQLRAIGTKTFIETFGPVNTEENMKRYLDESFSNGKLTTELSHPDSQFYFARLDDYLVGYLKLNLGEAQTELRDEHGLEIERIYVLNEFQGRNVGLALYGKALGVARERHCGYLWLGVWEKNAKAIGFYRKIGFVEFDKHVFKLGDDRQTDILMKLELQ